MSFNITLIVLGAICTCAQRKYSLFHCSFAVSRVVCPTSHLCFIVGGNFVFEIFACYSYIYLKNIHRQVLLDWCVEFTFVFLGSHKLCHTYGCYDSSDTQLCMTLDGEEVYYANFTEEDVIWDSRIPVALHVSKAYEFAVYYRSLCKGNLVAWKNDESISAATTGT